MAIAIKMDRVPIENETVLWQNPDPTVAFTAQTIAVTQSIRDFEKVRIYGYYYTSLTVRPGHIDIDMSQYDLFYDVADTAGLKFVLGEKNNSDTNYIRLAHFTTDSIQFGTGKQGNSTTTSNTHCIPYKVTGISRREITIPSKGNERIDVLWTNPAPNSALAANTEITLAQGAEKYDILRVYHKPATSDTPEVGRWVDFHIDKKPFNFMTQTDQVRMTLADLVGTITYTRGFGFPYDDGLPAQSSNPDADLYTTIKFGNGNRIANTTSNTSNIIPLIICGVNFVEGSRERIHNNFTVSTTGWSNSTVVFGGEDCYYNDIIITQYDDRTPVISIMADDLLISKNEQLAYKAGKYATVNTDTMKLRLYSPTVPANDFTIHVEGVM